MNTPKSPFYLGLLHPKYWLTWFAAGLWYLLILLPYPVLMALGELLGKLLYRVASRRRSIARRNLQLCFPQMDEHERTRLLKANFVSIGKALFEIGMAWFWSQSRLERLTVFEGREHLDKVHSRGQGVLLLTMHSTAIDLGGAMMSAAYSMCGVYRPHDNAAYEYLQIRGRQRRNPDSQLISNRDVRTFVKSLRQGRVVFYAPDQDLGRSNAEFVPFFGVNAATTVGATQLLRLGKACIVPYAIRRLPNNGGYRVTIYPVLEHLPSDNAVEDTLQITRFLEQRILEAPDQYLWVHRRFKTQPEHGENLYG